MMVRPQRDEIETFRSVTGASEEVAVRKLEEHGGNLNAALNAHFSEGESANAQPAIAPAVYDDDAMDVDEPVDVETVGPSYPHFRESLSFNPFSLLEEHINRAPFGRRDMQDVRSRAPRVLHPREVREIPIDFKDNSNPSGPRNHGPDIEYLSDEEAIVGPSTFGHVTVDEADENHETVSQSAGLPRQFGESDEHRHNETIIRETTSNAVSDNHDIEEEMIKAAIEASKRDAQRPPSPDLDVLIAREQGRTHADFPSDQSSHDIAPLGDSDGTAKINSINNRLQDPRASTSETSTNFTPGNIDEHPSMRHRHSKITSHASSSSKEAIVLDDSPPSSPQPREFSTNPNNRAADEWGGMTSEEQDEAVMLEAAMFGGIPEREAYKYSYPSLQAQVRPERHTSGYYNTRANRLPSPTLAAERMLREQQDDEYQAALQADRERELKETAAREAALLKEKTEEEEMRKKKLEEEEFERELTAKLAALPAEPASDDENAVKILVRVPDGSRHGRRFLKSDKLKSLFDFIDSGRVAKPKSYKLVRPYPRRAFGEEESGLSFTDLGMSGKQEALFMELL